MELPKQYFNREDLEKYFDIKIKIKNEDLISSDTYNETLLKESLEKLGEEAKELLFVCALHVSIIGSGNKTYGSIRYKDKVYEIKEVLTRYHVVYNKNINEKYEKSLLSIRRLIRMFRAQIQKWIVENNRPSYLWSKYSIKDEAMIPWCFPGSEHLVETKEQAIYLFETYKKLDQSGSTNFRRRLERVFISRNVVDPITIRKLSAA